jgi:hypothetical protein
MRAPAVPPLLRFTAQQSNGPVRNNVVIIETGCATLLRGFTWRAASIAQVTARLLLGA